MKLNKADITRLINEHTGKLKATIYIPTSTIPDQQNETRLKNALQVIKNDPSYDDRELGEVPYKIYDELLADENFWRYLDNGLAVMFDRDGYEYFHLPFEVAEAEYLTDQFIISPLALMASADTGFYLLDINFTNPRLFTGARGHLQEVEVKNMPKSYDKVMGRSRFKNHNLGGEDNAVNEDEKKYLQQIAEAVEPYLVYGQRALIVAGTINRIGHIKPLLKHEHVLNENLVGNFETATTEELYQEANKIVRPSLRKERDEIAEKFASTAPEYIVVLPEEIEDALNQGRVESLMVPSYRLTTDTVVEGEDDMAVLELPADIMQLESLVRATVRQGGSVIAVELDKYPKLDAVKALCRF